MATTRAATFSAKIRTLSEFQIRLSTNQQPPSNAEIITTLRYFQQTLIGNLNLEIMNRETKFKKFLNLLEEKLDGKQKNLLDYVIDGKHDVVITCKGDKPNYTYYNNNDPERSETFQNASVSWARKEENEGKIIYSFEWVNAKKSRFLGVIHETDRMRLYSLNTYKCAYHKSDAKIQLDSRTEKEAEKLMKSVTKTSENFEFDFCNEKGAYYSRVESRILGLSKEIKNAIYIERDGGDAYYQILIKIGQAHFYQMEYSINRKELTKGREINCTEENSQVDQEYQESISKNISKSIEINEEYLKKVEVLDEENFVVYPKNLLDKEYEELTYKKYEPVMTIQRQIDIINERVVNQKGKMLELMVDGTHVMKHYPYRTCYKREKVNFEFFNDNINRYVLQNSKVNWVTDAIEDNEEFYFFEMSRVYFSHVWHYTGYFKKSDMKLYWLTPYICTNTTAEVKYNGERIKEAKVFLKKSNLAKDFKCNICEKYYQARIANYNKMPKDRPLALDLSNFYKVFGQFNAKYIADAVRFTKNGKEFIQFEYHFALAHEVFYFEISVDDKEIVRGKMANC
ncbi:unnamed protein product [Caenorhabditis angaria]|uniref:Uncharacterized protein n=1 Tax=Caenorhabditis angaria TaxID=860376 RepID=A0A9P1IK35_9PELO|nr:unnamed protein product [Caenorhabditis angaria]